MFKLLTVAVVIFITGGGVVCDDEASVVHQNLFLGHRGDGAGGHLKIRRPQVGFRRQESNQITGQSSQNSIPLENYWKSRSRLSLATKKWSSGRNKRRHHRNLTPETGDKNKKKKKRPNIIFLLTDDQDIELGSMEYMPKTRRILADGGVRIKNAYVTTPMCCPSRSSILTGLYVHNHNVYTNGENCSSPQWQQTHERRTFATYLRDIGYRTAFFGKYLNEYNGSYIPPGWSDWSALIRNSRYYNYTLNVNGAKVRHGGDYHLDYYPDLILNDSLQYMRYSRRFFSSKPYLMVLSFPSPHGPEDSAPQFQEQFLNEKQHRTVSWNVAPNLDKQWLLRNTPKMSSIEQEFTDFLNAKRLQTLQSVDEAVSQIYDELKALNELDNTYIIYTSDHGYHLGQFGLVKGKAMPFEFDVHVPFLIRGPNVPPGKTLSQIVLNIDIAPTLLDIAGLRIPEHMDGTSFYPYIKELAALPPTTIQTKARDSFLIERGKFKVPHSVDRLLIPIIGKREWLKLECQKGEYQSPCKWGQKFECVSDDSGMVRIRKCHQHRISGLRRGKARGQCWCAPPPQPANDTGILQQTIHQSENDVLRAFTKQHRHRKWELLPKNLYLPDLNLNRRRRDFDLYPADEPSEFDVSGVYELKRLIDAAKVPTAAGATRLESKDNLSNVTIDDLLAMLSRIEVGNGTVVSNGTFCKIDSNNVEQCSAEFAYNQSEWKERRNFLNLIIRQLRSKLSELKGIRRSMNRKRPTHSSRKQEVACDCGSDWSAHPHHRRHQLRAKQWSRKRWLRKQGKKARKKEKFENTTCEVAASEQMNCFKHDNDHWKTAPFWTKGPFCFCQNSLNNSFWCLRTINETNNHLYCEFVTGFIAYFDLNKDPHQLQNAIYDLEFNVIEEMSRELARLKSCSGSSQCSPITPEKGKLIASRPRTIRQNHTKSNLSKQL